MRFSSTGAVGMRLLDYLVEICILLGISGPVEGKRQQSSLSMGPKAHKSQASIDAPSDPTGAAPILHARALPNAPDSYTPRKVDCPTDRPEIRDASSLSQAETRWLNDRRPKTIEPMLDLFERLNITSNGFDGASYITDHRDNITALPNIALAFSGGGYRAMLNGGGVLQAFDNREVNTTTTPGQLGGLLQAASYMAGLSGGNWLVGSIFMNNFTTISSLLTGPSGSPWELQNSILKGPDTGRIQLLDTVRYFDTIYDGVNGKSDAGFATSVTDYWGRALSFQIINAADGGPAYTWSSIAQSDHFANADTPFPIVVADGRDPGELLIPSNTTVYEFNPFEFGTFDPTVYGFAPLEYLGSNFSNGSISRDGSCIRGLDNAGFVMGTSSSLFNQFLLQSDTPDIPDLAKRFVKRVLETVSNADNDIAVYTPNPFRGYHPATNRGADSPDLHLVDGGEDFQNIPLHPLIQPARKVDVIFAVDSSADTDTYWPNGTSLVATYRRSLDPSGIANGTSFPAIPDQNTFVNLGLNRRPTFFGCNSSNTSDPTPLIVYLPNAPYNYHSNVSTFDRDYTIPERNAMVANGFNVATMGNATVDTTWPQCVGCAILSRSFERTGTPVPDPCQQCFQQFCWDGRVNGTLPSTTYAPDYVSPSIDLDAKKSAAVPSIKSDCSWIWALVCLGWGITWWTI